MKKRIIRKFSINEISMVPTPAQAGARMAIMKSADEDDDPVLVKRGREMFWNNVEKAKVVSKEPFSKVEVDTLAAELTSGDKRISPARAHLMSVGRLMKREGLYDSAFLSKGGQESTEEDLEDEAATKFNALVATIKSRDNCSGTAALRKARIENPAAFAAFQD